MMYRIRIFLFPVILLLSVAPILLAQTHTVRVMTIDGTINPATADFVKLAVEQSHEAESECLIVKLNTPGGLLKSTRVIVSEFLNSPIPVVVYVSPAGSQAASAGVFITLAGHLAVMAPGTNIGAAHPVTIGGQKDTVMIEKATNDAAAFIRTISEKRKRNIQWAEDAVRKSLSITESEALKMNVIDTIASDLGNLLTIIDGKEVETSQGRQTLRTKEASVVEIEPSFKLRILDLLSDPNIAYILMMLGIYGLLFELYNPGSILPGVVGIISLILAFYSLHTLPVNYAGLALIIVAIILFILEIKVVSYGILTIGGVISLVLGSLMLLETESALEVVAISWQIIVAVSLFTTLFFVFAIGFAIKAQRRKPTTGMQGIVGERGEAITTLEPEGHVRVHGEIWKAVSLDGLLEKGTKIQVESIENLKLNVRKLN